MSKGKASGYSLTNHDASIVLGQIARGDREHDIAAWFGVNQGRIADVKEGKWGSLTAAPETELPPKGAPGVKGRRLRAYVESAIEALSGPAPDPTKALRELRAGLERYDRREA